MIQLLNEQITKQQQAIRALDLRADLSRQEYEQMVYYLQQQYGKQSNSSRVSEASSSISNISGAVDKFRKYMSRQFGQMGGSRYTERSRAKSRRSVSIKESSEGSHSSFYKQLDLQEEMEPVITRILQKRQYLKQNFEKKRRMQVQNLMELKQAARSQLQAQRLSVNKQVRKSPPKPPHHPINLDTIECKIKLQGKLGSRMKPYRYLKAVRNSINSMHGLRRQFATDISHISLTQY